MCRERVYIEPQLILRGLSFEPLVIRHIKELNLPLVEVAHTIIKLIAFRSYQGSLHESHFCKLLH